MSFKEIQELLQKYHYYGHTVHREKHKLSYTFHSIAYYAVDIIVDVIKLDCDRIVSNVQIGKINIDDFKDLMPTLNNINKIQKETLFYKKKGK